MKHSLVSLLFILVLATQVFGQDAGNADIRQKFNGTWIFDTRNSDRKYKDLYNGQSFEISYNEPELKIVTTRTMKFKKNEDETKSATWTLFTDNRGETNNPYPFNQGLEIKSKTVWDKDRLIRNYTVKIYKEGKVIGGHTIKETYTISEDGNTLTILTESHLKTSSDSPYGELKTDDKGKAKLVYTRVK